LHEKEAFSRYSRGFALAFSTSASIPALPAPISLVLPRLRFRSLALQLFVSIELRKIAETTVPPDQNDEEKLSLIFDFHKHPEFHSSHSFPSPFS
jgi:hypothetical protein